LRSSSSALRVVQQKIYDWIIVVALPDVGMALNPKVAPLFERLDSAPDRCLAQCDLAGQPPKARKRKKIAAVEMPSNGSGHDLGAWQQVWIAEHLAEPSLAPAIKLHQ
jgi:hypothetical protein